MLTVLERGEMSRVQPPARCCASHYKFPPNFPPMRLLFSHYSVLWYVKLNSSFTQHTHNTHFSPSSIQDTSEHTDACPSITILLSTEYFDVETKPTLNIRTMSIGNLSSPYLTSPLLRLLPRHPTFARNLRSLDVSLLSCLKQKPPPFLSSRLLPRRAESNAMQGPLTKRP